MITFAYDAYGAYARASYCADFIELQALSGGPVRWGDFDDYLDNAGATVNELIQLPEESNYDDGEDGQDDRSLGRTSAVRPRGIELVKSVLAERADVLGHRYPFVLAEEWIEAGPEVSESPYGGILALCQLHVAKVDGELNPELAFEVSVHASLEAFGLVAAHVGTGAGGGFRGSVEAAAATLDFAANPSGVARSRAAKDDGIDHVAKVDFHDKRPGQWVLIGQTTCARSGDWKKKANEPSRDAWSTYLSFKPRPHRFLAVPHHVDQAPLAYLVGHVDDGFVFDRLRLCAVRTEQTAEEKIAFQQLIRLGVEPLR